MAGRFATPTRPSRRPQERSTPLRRHHGDEPYQRFAALLQGLPVRGLPVPSSDDESMDSRLLSSYPFSPSPASEDTRARARHTEHRVSVASTHSDIIFRNPNGESVTGLTPMTTSSEADYYDTPERPSRRPSSTRTPESKKPATPKKKPSRTTGRVTTRSKKPAASASPCMKKPAKRSLKKPAKRKV